MSRLLRPFCAALIFTVVAISVSPGLAQMQRPNAARILGLLDVSPGERADTLKAPTTAKVGESFPITITTSGGGCESAGDASVILGDLEANVTVYDMTVATRPNVACTMIFKRMPHTASIRFSKPGDAVIRVWGRRTGSDTPSFGSPTVIEYHVKVQ